MFKIQTLNEIAPAGIEKLPRKIFRTSTDAKNPDAILLRSFNLNDYELPASVKAIARAGAGVNNIPIERCTDRGVVVFNTPGANANSVKELVIAGLLLASRRILEGTHWARSLSGSNSTVEELVEKEKSRFTGPEIAGKQLGVIGLGSVGGIVANDASSLGMDVTGYDPYISVEAAWGLSRDVKRAQTIEPLLRQSDFITLNLPLNEKTEHFLNSKHLGMMKRGVKILNFARGKLVNTNDIIRAMDSGIVDCFVTDFPNKELVGHEKVIPIPHLGASTPEAEENSAIMAVEQLKEFLLTGNVMNSVNYPDCRMSPAGDSRIIIANKNIPTMVAQITTVLAEDKINISDMLNRHRGDYAYTIIDIEGKISDSVIEKLEVIEGVTMAREIKPA